jgi:UDP-N-acetylglucosamine 2-epimerase (non-hydrolysing)
MKKILHVVGARPNFMKLAPVYEGLKAYSNIEQLILHTGQHFDYNMSGIFFKQLNLPEPDFNLGINGDSVLNQIGTGILKIEEILIQHKPHLVCIYGDVNAVVFTSIAASKLGIKIAHIEAGLRSFDRSMPEETNRLIADCLSDYCFTPSEEADKNLIIEGKAREQIFFVGNIMIDSLVKYVPFSNFVQFKFQLPPKFVLATLHRPSNVDDENNLIKLINCLEDIGNKYKIIFPIHPRTRKKIDFNIDKLFRNIIFVEPLNYFEFIFLERNAEFIITDSGGVQEESTYLGTPCFTLRDNTERPVTLTVGTNTLVGSDVSNLKATIAAFFCKPVRSYRVPDLWDGNAGSRVAKIISTIL